MAASGVGGGGGGGAGNGKSCVVPAPSYRVVEKEEVSWDTPEDAPGPRCGHSLTAVAPTKTRGPRLILFGGATAIEGSASASASRSSSPLHSPSSSPSSVLPLPGIRLASVTNSVHSYDVDSKKWTRIHPVGAAPSPRAAHAAAAVGTMVVFQGGIGPAGHSTDDLYVLDLTNDKFKWDRVVVQGPGPGPRYGHTMDLVTQRYLVTVSGNDGKRVLSDAWVLDTAQKPYRWQKLHPDGDRPSARMYATVSARSDGMLLMCGGRDASGMPLSDAYGLLMHTNGQWEWTLSPGVSPSPRYQHAAVFVGARLHVTGGVLRGGRSIEGEGAIAVLDTAARVWLDRNGTVTSSRKKPSSDPDPILELLRRCRHAAASVGSQIFIYGGLKGDVLLEDFLVAENSPVRSDMTASLNNLDRVVSETNLKSQGLGSTSASNHQPTNGRADGGQGSIDMLTQASAEEVEAVDFDSDDEDLMDVDAVAVAAPPADNDSSVAAPNPNPPKLSSAITQAQGPHKTKGRGFRDRDDERSSRFANAHAHAQAQAQGPRKTKGPGYRDDERSSSRFAITHAQAQRPCKTKGPGFRDDERSSSRSTITHAQAQGPHKTKGPGFRNRDDECSSRSAITHAQAQGPRKTKGPGFRDHDDERSSSRFANANANPNPNPNPNARDFDSLTSDGGPGPHRYNQATVARRQKWTAKEEAAIKAAVNKHGVGKWRIILDDPEFSTELQFRSNIDLKDKWRNISVTRNVGRVSSKRAKLAVPKADQAEMAYAEAREAIRKMEKTEVVEVQAAQAFVESMILRLQLL